MAAGMKLRFWGVRGSVPSPGPSTARYGGNTSCVSLDLGDRMLVFDSGTGIRGLGKELLDRDCEVYLLVSHPHWDHIQGFPFFEPIYQPGRDIHIFVTQDERSLLCALVDQMDGVHFPITATDTLPPGVKCVADDEIAFLRDRGFEIDRIDTNHPGGAHGYRVEHRGRSIVYLTDNELDPPYARTNEPEAFADFARTADVLIHDAQYLDSDMPHKHGWGHSLVSHTCDLAVSAGVRHLVLFHHGQDRPDDDVAAIEKDARARLVGEGGIECTAAFEGLSIDLEPS